MDENLKWGLFGMLLGVFSFWFTKKYPEKGKDIWKLDIKGYLGGGICIIVGIIFLAKYFLHK
jgi:hypothetical protein